MKKKTCILATVAILLISLIIVGCTMEIDLFGQHSEDDFVEATLSEEEDLLLRQAVYDSWSHPPSTVTVDTIKITSYYGEYKGIKAFQYSYPGMIILDEVLYLDGMRYDGYYLYDGSGVFSFKKAVQQETMEHEDLVAILKMIKEWEARKKAEYESIHAEEISRAAAESEEAKRKLFEAVKKAYLERYLPGSTQYTEDDVAIFDQVRDVVFVVGAKDKVPNVNSVFVYDEETNQIYTLDEAYEKGFVTENTYKVSKKRYSEFDFSSLVPQ